MDQYGQLQPDEYCLGLLSKGERIDGRSLTASRALSVQVGVARKAAASAMVKQGPTTVMSVVTTDLCVPSTPNDGRLVVSLSAFEGVDQDAISQTRTVLTDLCSNDSIIRLRDLCIATGRVAWSVHCNLTVLSAENSSLLSACLTAVEAALGSLRLPKVLVADPPAVIDLKTAQGVQVIGGETTKLALAGCPVAVSFAFHAVSAEQSLTIVDPSDKELATLGQPLTVVAGRDGRLYSVFGFGFGKGPLFCLDDLDLDKCISASVKMQYPVEQTILAAINV